MDYIPAREWTIRFRDPRLPLRRTARLPASPASVAGVATFEILSLDCLPSFSLIASSQGAQKKSDLGGRQRRIGRIFTHGSQYEQSANAFDLA